ncbi:MAG TPA: T9SS type A sorting domain-containing protein [Ignavibacteria bacterium]|nr:T9SS type A sorting domain-containing protein [Ignavibacteria bacterium]HMQ98340.1 T9SS type A sorting domain-containing protein [Ignavibacteria bacterium]
MKFNLTTALFFALLSIFSVNSQSVNNVVWESPSYEMSFRGTTGSNKSPGEGSEPIFNSGFDFTSAGDYYNSQSNLSVISFTLTKPGFVNIKIYDQKGNTIDELARSSFGKGAHEVKWNSSKMQEGSYYYSIITEEFSVTKKIK